MRKPFDIIHHSSTSKKKNYVYSTDAKVRNKTGMKLDKINQLEASDLEKKK